MLFLEIPVIRLYHRYYSIFYGEYTIYGYTAPRGQQQAEILEAIAEIFEILKSEILKFNRYLRKWSLKSQKWHVPAYLKSQ